MSKYEKGLDRFEEAIFSDHYITRHSDKLRMDGRINQMETIHLKQKGIGINYSDQQGSIAKAYQLAYK